MAGIFESVVTALSFIVSGVGSVVGIRTEEEPRYEVLVRDGDHEVRAYAPYLVATTRASGARNEAANASFRVLAGYIFGDNQTREKLPMTAPVVMKPEGESIGMTAPVVMVPEGPGWTMSFVLPARYTRATLPLPNSARIEIRDVPAEDLAVVRFSGFAGEDEVRRQERALRSWIASTQGGAFEAGEGFRYAGYDPPFTVPMLRRNEVMVPVRRVVPGG